MKDVGDMRKLIVISMVMAMTLLLVLPTVTAAPRTKEGTVYMNDDDTIYMGSWNSGSTHNVKVTTNASVDVYILSSDQKIGYPESFTYTKAWENTKNVDGKFSAKANTLYYLVIDNHDNGQSSDAIPSGDVTFSATYPNILDQIQSDVDDLAWTGFWVCMGPIIVVVVIIVVVIVVIVYLLVKKKKTPPQQQQPQQPQYQQPYQQQPYQQQYQQPPQQPPYQQQPSQYEPPPPPPQY